MELDNIILLAIIQGITEWLPVSSSGHLALAQEFFHIKASVLFDLSLHIGSLVALLVFLRNDIQRLVRALFGKEKEGQKLLFFIFLATLFTALIVFPLKSYFLSFFKNTLAIGIALFITGILLFITKFIKEENKNIGLKDSIIIGIAQGIAFIPGISRSGSTISAALFRGINKEEAVKFSFLLFIPAVLGAFLLQLKETGPLEEVNSLLLGMILSFIVSYLSIHLLLKIIRKHKFHYFAYYCFAIGIITILLSLR